MCACTSGVIWCILYNVQTYMSARNKFIILSWVLYVAVKYVQRLVTEQFITIISVSYSPERRSAVESAPRFAAAVTFNNTFYFFLFISRRSGRVRMPIHVSYIIPYDHTSRVSTRNEYMFLWFTIISFWNWRYTISLYYDDIRTRTPNWAKPIRINNIHMHKHWKFNIGTTFVKYFK